VALSLNSGNFSPTDSMVCSLGVQWDAMQWDEREARSFANRAPSVK